jgi:glycogen debranching enzyme
MRNSLPRGHALVEHVVRINDEFYVLASSCLADDRTRVLKYGPSFAVFDRLGDVETVGLGEHGLYYRETRHLSRFVVKLGNDTPQLLRSGVRDDNALLTVDTMNVDISEDDRVIVPRGSLHLFRSKFLSEAVCYEHFRISNYSLTPVDTFITVQFQADFHDIFEVRGVHREHRGRILQTVMEHDTVLLAYHGLDGVVRRTRIKFCPSPVRLSERTARFQIALEPKAETSLYVTTSFESDDARPTVLDFAHAMHQKTEEIAVARLGRSHIISSDPRFNSWIARSTADLEMMMVGNPEGDYPYAGVPWFSTVFGRDGILTALECLWIAPWIARSVLKYLAETQATEIDPRTEAEPGKILHEMRRGEMAALNEVPFRRYYGAVDTTPLFVILAGAYFDRTRDDEFLQTIWPNVLGALDWIDTYGDPDHDGFVEYEAKSSKGLVQQGWKDSHDSIFHSDGTIAPHPIALCEVQGYVFAAKQAAARLAQIFHDKNRVGDLVRQGEALQGKFEDDFWDDQLGTYVLALDGEKKPCRVRASNAGHCLFSGIASPQRARAVAKSLLGDEMFCGWGIRTLGSKEVRYNPMAYHNGSVWPHDNAIAARGFARYGLHEEVLTVFSALLEASTFMDLHRLPELYCGFHRRSSSEGPTLYPVACSPQAWAAGAVYLLLEACLGLSMHPEDSSVQIAAAQLPEFLNNLRIKKLQLGESEFDILVRNDAQNIQAEIVPQPTMK